jgi:hypothetical protein
MPRFAARIKLRPRARAWRIENEIATRALAKAENATHIVGVSVLGGSPNVLGDLKKSSS